MADEMIVARKPAKRLTANMSTIPGLALPVAMLISWAEIATRVNTDTAKRKLSEASRRARG